MAAAPESLGSANSGAQTAPVDRLDQILAGTATAANEVTANLPAIMSAHPLEGVEDTVRAAEIIGQMLTDEKSGKGIRAYPRRILRQQHIAGFLLINPFASTTEVCAYFGIGPSTLNNITKSDTFKTLVSAHRISMESNIGQDLTDQLRQTLQVAIEVTQEAVITKRDPDFALQVMDKAANRLGLGAKHNNAMQVNVNVVTPEMIAMARARRLPDAR